MKVTDRDADYISALFVGVKRKFNTNMWRPRMFQGRNWHSEDSQTV